MQYEFVILRACAILPSKHKHTMTYNGNNDSALVFVRWLNAWNGCRVGPKRTESTFVLLCVHLDLEVLLVFDPVWGCSLTLMRYICCPNTLQWQWWLCIDLSSLVECIERVLCWPWASRLCVCIAACALELEDVIDVEWMRYEVVFSPFWYAGDGDSALIFVCWICCVDLKQTDCTYTSIYCLNLTRVTDVR